MHRRVPVGCEDLGKRLGQLGTLYGAVLINEQLGEETLVDLPFHELRGCFVVPVAASSYRQGVLQRLFNVCQTGVGGLDLLLGTSHGSGQALHLSFQQVQRHCVGIVSLHQPGAFILQARQSLVGPFGPLVCVSNLRCHVGAHSKPGGRDCLLGELEAGVEGCDAVLDLF